MCFTFSGRCWRCSLLSSCEDPCVFGGRFEIRWDGFLTDRKFVTFIFFFLITVILLNYWIILSKSLHWFTSTAEEGWWFGFVYASSAEENLASRQTSKELRFICLSWKAPTPNPFWSVVYTQVFVLLSFYCLSFRQHVECLENVVAKLKPKR